MKRHEGNHEEEARSCAAHGTAAIGAAASAPPHDGHGARSRGRAAAARRALGGAAQARGHILLRVSACGICRTDLHVLDGDLADPKPHVIPGHEIIGRVAAIGPGVTGFKIGDRVGVPWLGSTCGRCAFCRERPREPVRPARASPATRIDGGYAEYATADAAYAFAIPAAYTPTRKPRR